MIKLKKDKPKIREAEEYLLEVLNAQRKHSPN